MAEPSAARARLKKIERPSVEERERVEEIMALPSSVFVFGSNMSGVHGRGAAKDAAHRYGARHGVGAGMTGRSYAIPTKKHWKDKVGMSLDDIRPFIEDFLNFARTHPLWIFAVTKIGCGLAGFQEADIAPLFLHAPTNCVLPGGWSHMPIDEVER